MKIKIVLVALILASAAGCSQEAPPASSPGSTATPVAGDASPGPAAKQVQPPIGDATFSINPGSFRTCDAENGAITATAKWDVSAKNIAEVSIFVTDTKGERKLWLNGGTTGESTTGNWVFPDSKFELVELGGEKAIAELTVKAIPCE
jgi:hypothetical protein